MASEWHEYVDEATGTPYLYNPLSGESRWLTATDLTLTDNTAVATTTSTTTPQEEVVYSNQDYAEYYLSLGDEANAAYYQSLVDQENLLSTYDMAATAAVTTDNNDAPTSTSATTAADNEYYAAYYLSIGDTESASYYQSLADQDQSLLLDDSSSVNAVLGDGSMSFALGGDNNIGDTSLFTEDGRGGGGGGGGGGGEEGAQQEKATTFSNIFDDQNPFNSILDNNNKINNNNNSYNNTNNSTPFQNTSSSPKNNTTLLQQPPSSSLMAPPPPPPSLLHSLSLLSWEMYLTDKGQAYYYNLETGETRWTIPLEVSAKEASIREWMGQGERGGGGGSGGGGGGVISPSSTNTNNITRNGGTKDRNGMSSGNINGTTPRSHSPSHSTTSSFQGLGLGGGRLSPSSSATMSFNSTRNNKYEYALKNAAVITVPEAVTNLFSGIGKKRRNERIMRMQQQVQVQQQQQRMHQQQQQQQQNDGNPFAMLPESNNDNVDMRMSTSDLFLTMASPFDSLPLPPQLPSSSWQNNTTNNNNNNNNNNNDYNYPPFQTSSSSSPSPVPPLFSPVLLLKIRRRFTAKSLRSAVGFGLLADPALGHASHMAPRSAGKKFFEQKWTDLFQMYGLCWKNEKERLSLKAAVDDNLWKTKSLVSQQIQQPHQQQQKIQQYKPIPPYLTVLEFHAAIRKGLIATVREITDRDIEVLFDSISSSPGGTAPLLLSAFLDFFNKDYLMEEDILFDDFARRSITGLAAKGPKVAVSYSNATIDNDVNFNNKSNNKSNNANSPIQKLAFNTATMLTYDLLNLSGGVNFSLDKAKAAIEEKLLKDRARKVNRQAASSNSFMTNNNSAPPLGLLVHKQLTARDLRNKELVDEQVVLHGDDAHMVLSKNPRQSERGKRRAGGQQWATGGRRLKIMYAVERMFRDKDTRCFAFEALLNGERGDTGFTTLKKNGASAKELKVGAEEIMIDSARVALGVVSGNGGGERAGLGYDYDPDVHHVDSKVISNKVRVTPKKIPLVPPSKLDLIRKKMKSASYTSNGSDPVRLFKLYDNDRTGFLSLERFKALLRRNCKITKDVIQDSEMESIWRHICDLKVGASGVNGRAGGGEEEEREGDRNGEEDDYSENWDEEEDDDGEVEDEGDGEGDVDVENDENEERFDVIDILGSPPISGGGIKENVGIGVGGGGNVSGTSSTSMNRSATNPIPLNLNISNTSKDSHVKAESNQYKTC